MTIKEIQLKLYEKLKPSGWGERLRMFILSDDFAKILIQLYKETQEGIHFTPTLKDLFRAFEECPFDKLKIVIIAMDPYPQENVADGISFSCSKTKKEQPSLRYIFNEIEHTNATKTPRDQYNPDLVRWSNQGILMLNTALTCQITKIGSHLELWAPFIDYLLQLLDQDKSQVAYVFLGKKAQAYHKKISSNNYKFFTTHPASAAYKGQRGWDSGNLFNQLNKWSQKIHNTEIIW